MRQSLIPHSDRVATSADVDLPGPSGLARQVFEVVEPAQPQPLPPSPPQANELQRVRSRSNENGGTELNKYQIVKFT